MSRPNRFFILSLALFTLCWRLMPWVLQYAGVSIDPKTTIYPWNFSPMTAFCLFGAAYCAKQSWAYGLPILMWILGDLGIAALMGDITWAFHKGSLPVYASFVLIIGIGSFLREKRNMPTILSAGLTGQVMFFLITNFFVWCLSPNVPTNFEIAYSKDVAGLLQCYTNGLPFFGRSLAGTLFFSVVFFSPFLYREHKKAVWASESPRATA